MTPSDPPAREPRLRALPGERTEPPAAPAPAVDGALALTPEAPAAPPLRAVPEGERAPLDEASPWLRALAQAFAEALSGCRPAAPLRPVVSPAVYATLAHGGPSFRGQPYRPRLWRLRTCTVDPDHVEAAAIVRLGDGYRALALRLDRTPKGWRCTALRVG